MEDLKIVAVHKEGSEITQYKLSNDTVIDKELALQYVVDGYINDYILCTSKLGETYLRAKGDGDDSNNLQNLPEF